MIALDKGGFKMILTYILWKSEKLFLSRLDMEIVHSEEEKGTLQS